MRIRGWAGLAMICVGLSRGARAQETPMRVVDGGVPTLRVFANLIQLPTLVLDRFGEPVKEKPGQKFMVSIDSGKPFRATHVRLEGEDPITLTILLDDSGYEGELLKDIPGMLRRTVPAGLRAHDHVSVYGVDCGVQRTLNDAPADAAQIEDALKRVRASTSLHGGKPGPSCRSSVHLWDTMNYIVRTMYAQPGRRVLLVVSSGADGGSQHTWNEVRDMAQKTGVAVFGMRLPVSVTTLTMRGQLTSSAGVQEDFFDTLCQLSGGRVLTPSMVQTDKVMQAFFRMVRARYIVQFPRPDGAGAGVHGIEVTMPGTTYYIRAAGISVPIATTEEKSVPTVLQADPANQPEAGTRRILTPGTPPPPQ